MRFISRLKYNSNCPVVVMTLLVNHYHPVVMRGDVDKTTFLGLFDLTRLGPPTDPVTASNAGECTFYTLTE